VFGSIIRDYFAWVEQEGKLARTLHRKVKSIWATRPVVFSKRRKVVRVISVVRFSKENLAHRP